jgi:hypothetical protein
MGAQCPYRTRALGSPDAQEGSNLVVRQPRMRAMAQGRSPGQTGLHFGNHDHTRRSSDDGRGRLTIGSGERRIGMRLIGRCWGHPAVARAPAHRAELVRSLPAAARRRRNNHAARFVAAGMVRRALGAHADTHAGNPSEDEHQNGQQAHHDQILLPRPSIGERGSRRGYSSVLGPPRVVSRNPSVGKPQKCAVPAGASNSPMDSLGGHVSDLHREDRRFRSRGTQGAAPEFRPNARPRGNGNYLIRASLRAQTQPFQRSPVSARLRPDRGIGSPLLPSPGSKRSLGPPPRSPPKPPGETTALAAAMAESSG